MSQKICPSCNAPNDPNASFCGNCGAPLGSEQAAPAVPTPPVPPTPAYQPPSPPPPPNPSYQAPASPQQPADYQQPGSYQAPGGYQQAGGYQPPSGYQPPAGGYQTPPPSGMSIPAGYAPAGFGVRFVAYLIDAVALGVIGFVIAAIGLSNSLLSFLIGAGYFIGFWVTKGQTPGKMVMGLYVITAEGQPLDWTKAIIRYVGYLVSGFILGIGFLMIAFDDAKRGLHDRIASTLVIKRV